MNGVWVRAGVAALLLIGVFAGVVAILDATVFSADGFVRTYLGMLQRKDATAALELAGPDAASTALDDLLVPERMSDLDSFALTDSPRTTGVHVDVAYVADGKPGATGFDVVRTGSVLGFFPQWGFAASPLAEVDLTVLHTRSFTANGADLVAPAQDTEATYLAFTPGVVTFAHTSELLEASPVSVVLGEPGDIRSVQLDARANDRFRQEVQAQADAFITSCLTQHVLQPTGCPFGQEIDDVVASEPDWSNVAFPEITIEPTPTAGEWLVPPATGVVHLSVKVQAYYDGSVTTYETDVPYDAVFVVTVTGTSTFVVTPQID